MKTKILADFQIWISVPLILEPKFGDDTKGIIALEIRSDKISEICHWWNFDKSWQKRLIGIYGSYAAEIFFLDDRPRIYTIPPLSAS